MIVIILFWFLFLINALLKFADCYSTWYALTMYPNQMREANPIAKFSMDKIGVMPDLILSWIIHMAILMFTYFHFSSMLPALLVMIGSTLILIYVVDNNLRSLKRVKNKRMSEV